jgi:hypothetical protein
MAKEPLSDIAPPREDREAFRAFAIAHDTRSADIYRQRMELTDSMERDYDTIRRMAGQEIVGYGRDRRWNGKVEDAIATLWADVEEATRNGDHNLTKREGRRGFTKTNDAQRALERIDAKKKELLELDLQREHERQVMADAGGWSQAFLAVTNGDGHVHSSMVCPTCNRGKDWTRFAWMVEYSGANEEEIVDAAGVRACTVCYPSAPVESLNKPTRMFTPDEVEKAKAREEREAAKIAKDAKKKANAATPDGSELRISTGDGYTERFSTESSAMSWATGHYYNFMSEHDENGVYPEWMDLRSGVTQIAESIAAKRGVPVEEVMAEIIAKADAKAKKSVKERAAWRAQNPNFA